MAEGGFEFQKRKFAHANRKENSVPDLLADLMLINIYTKWERGERRERFLIMTSNKQNSDKFDGISYALLTSGGVIGYNTGIKSGAITKSAN